MLCLLLYCLMFNSPLAPADSYTVTAFCSCERCCGKPPAHKLYGITASGQRARWGVVAADWGVLPRGTRIALSCFPGQTFVVLDKGGAIKGRRLDVWFPTHAEALRFGVKKRVIVTQLDSRGGDG